MKVIVAGGRDFKDYNYAMQSIASILLGIESNSDEIEFVSGHAKGADAIGEQYAKEYGYKLKLFPANWDKYGKSAGVIRNKEMAEYASPDGVLIAFWDKKSRGTANMIKEATRCGLKVCVCVY